LLYTLGLVYDLSEEGNITQYLKSTPDASRLKLLLEVAQGLQYLHSLDIIHGNLKGTNVLISESKVAQVSDYGLHALLNPKFAAAATPGMNQTGRWLAPERDNSKPADVFAFAMLAIELYTGEVPFGPEMKPERATLLISEGKRPGMPPGLTEEIRKCIKSCWDQNPNKRPTIDQVVNTLERVVNPGANKPPKLVKGEGKGEGKARWWRLVLCSK